MLPLRSTAIFALTTALMSLPAKAAEPVPSVVVSIKPLHSLVSAVMAGVGDPHLLRPDGASPHGYSLRLSDAKALESADAVFWVGEDLETFLHDAIHTLAEDAVSTEVAELPDVDLLPVRESGLWAPHNHHGDEHEHEEHADEHEYEHGDEHEHDEHADEHEHEHGDEHEHEEHGDEHEHGAHDMHIWLDPNNARRIVAATADILSELDAEHAAQYQANAKAADRQLAALDNELGSLLMPVKDQPFIVFHDAYGYLERHYELTARGSIVIDPEQAPGAKRIAELRDLIAERGAKCLFSEPQFEPRMVKRLAADTGIRTEVLDPLGVGIDLGPDAYADMMRRNAEAIRSCLDVTG